MCRFNSEKIKEKYVYREKEKANEYGKPFTCGKSG